MKKCLQAREIIEFEKSPDRIRQLIESAGNSIASVHFIKRGDGSLRKMAYRLHVRNPTIANVPQGLTDRTTTDMGNDQVTVLDVNKVVRDDMGNKIGRGAWRTIPLEGVTRITVKGLRYIIAK